MLFNNSGTVNVQGGTLNLADGGTHTGLIDVAAGTQLTLGGTHDFNGGSLTSAGTLQLHGTAVNFNAGTLTSTGTLNFTASAVNFNTAGVNYNFAGTNNITTGTVAFGTNNATFASLNQTNGQVTGSGNLTVSGAATFEQRRALRAGHDPRAGRHDDRHNWTAIWTAAGCSATKARSRRAAKST